MSTKTEFIVILQSAWMNETGHGVNYSWDRRRFSTYGEAVDHGFVVRDSDDFNIALIEGNTLTGFYWMYEPLHDHLPDAAKQLCLAFDRSVLTRGQMCHQSLGEGA